MISDARWIYIYLCAIWGDLIIRYYEQEMNKEYK